MTMLEIALECIARGWYVFPCWPKTKKPMTPNGFKDATNSEQEVRACWTANPTANVAIATGKSGLCVVDIDHGLEPGTLLGIHGFQATYAVRTGRRPEFGVQLYYSGTGLKSTGWEHGKLKGDIRCSTGYVMAAGSIHPSGEAYEVLIDGPIVPVPEYVRSLTVKQETFGTAECVEDERADDWKQWLLGYIEHYGLTLRGYEKRAANGWWFGIQCPWEHEHSSGAGAESSTVLGILDGKIIFVCPHTACSSAKRDTAFFKRFITDMAFKVGVYLEEPGADIGVKLGTGLPAQKEKPLDISTFFDDPTELLNCPNPTFFIKNWLYHQGILAIAAPVAQRKSLLVLNTIWSLLTGKPLFGFLPVITQPKRVLYLCPEMGRISIKQRIVNMGLAPFLIDGTLLVRTMNQGAVDIINVLSLPDSILVDSVVVLDTAIRFMQGDEQSSKDMKVFSSQLFELQRRQGDGGGIIILYHSPKTTKDAFELTLENCLRGSGELGAAVTDAHGTKMQPVEEGKHAWSAISFISHVKDRDYEGEQDFEVECERATGLMTRCGDGTVKAVLKTKKPGAKGNPEQDNKIVSIFKAYLPKHPGVPIKGLQKMLAEDFGIKLAKTKATELRLLAREGGGGSSVTSE